MENVDNLEKDICIQLKDVTVRFNMAGEKVDNLKEYFVKLIKRELHFKEFLALKNVNLTIRQGEAWALIGNNGAGKSTMLRLICRILAPYKGTVSVRGTIAPNHKVHDACSDHYYGLPRHSQRSASRR